MGYFKLQPNVGQMTDRQIAPQISEPSVHSNTGSAIRSLCLQSLTTDHIDR